MISFDKIIKSVIDFKEYSLCKTNKINNSYNSLLGITNNSINLPNIIKKCLTHKYKDLNALIKDLNQIK